MHVPAISGGFYDAHKNMIWVLHACTTISSDCHNFVFYPCTINNGYEMDSIMGLGHD